jgi:hypothetical protein
MESLLERFIRSTKVDIQTECFIWLLHINNDGYARIKYKGLDTPASRVFYRYFKGDFPSHYHIDHLCKNRSCVNPEHLEAVSARVNILRSDGPAAINANKTHCKRGHEFTTENTAHYPNGSRRCRECYKLNNKKRVIINHVYIGHKK